MDKHHTDQFPLHAAGQDARSPAVRPSISPSDAWSVDARKQFANCQFMITGMTCASEAVGLERRFKRQTGVVAVMVNPITEQAYISFDPALTNPEILVSTITSAGYGIA